jgi:hypothetical protein
MSTKWKSLEDYVRSIAELRWNVACNPEHIDGVDFDGVCRVSADELVLIEITTERNLSKVRRDLNKIIPTRNRLAANGEICRGFIVLDEQPTNSMIEAGQKVHIAVCSADDFERSFFDFQSYISLRSKIPFGSAVNSETGKTDTRSFISVNYTDQESSKNYKISEIAQFLQRGGRVVLTGDYGTGKSRCVLEVFDFLKGDIRNSAAFPIAINLRDHWSSSNALEIIAGHLGNIGFQSSIDNVVRLLNSGHLILLLDGFDEIGTQVHDINIEDRRSLRKRAVQGVRDLIAKTHRGLLITGRSHFFDSNEEMIESLGLSISKDIICLGAPETFSTDEGAQYLSELGIFATIPSWLPRKPLVFQIIAELDSEDVTELLSTENAEITFWNTFINVICRRESKGVGDSISPQTIQRILEVIAEQTRYANTISGRLTPTDIDTAYQSVVGSIPDQSGRQLLSRMCTLGRIEPESPDRQFIDISLLDVLRANALVVNVLSMTDNSSRKKWIQPLGLLGVTHASQAVQLYHLEQHFFSYLKKFGNSQNTIILGEIVSILTVNGRKALDFQSLQIACSTLPILNLGNRQISNLIVKESEIGLLILDETLTKNEDGIMIDGCLITSATGISAHAGLPSWVINSEVIDFVSLSNSARIKEATLSATQKLFVAIVHKIFFQPGSGRKESALLKGGYGQEYIPILANKIVRILINHGVISKFNGDSEPVYKPVRGFSSRMNKMLSQLTLSEDEIWKEISEISS